MDKLSYKTFVWPQNPESYREEWLREPQYKTVDGEVFYTGMGPVRHIVTGSGCFWGKTAIEDFQRLAALFVEDEPGNLQHPLMGIRYCYFTDLELVQEPEEERVRYNFTFTVALSNGEVPK